MPYTWGYLKENTLAKLNMNEEEANQQNFLSRFPYYANEAMTQICSAIKPHEVFITYNVYNKQEKWDELRKKYNVYDNFPEYTEILPNRDDPNYDDEVAFWKEWATLYFVDEPITFPEDFVGFSDDVAEIKEPALEVRGVVVCMPKWREAYDEDFDYYGYNQVICHKMAQYKIPYKARWFFFTKDLDNDIVLPIPADICDALPSYIASQCWKIDDETRAALYRNEFEMACARIDDTTFKSQRTFHVDGGW